MADVNEQKVERIVSQVLEGHVARLREDLVHRVLEELPQEAEEGGAAPNANAADQLLRAVTGIHAGSTQKEILRALLDHAAQYADRLALFVIKGGAATGWQGRGFEDNDAIKDFRLDVSRGLPQRVLEEKVSYSGQVIDMDPRFLDMCGKPGEEPVLMLPLLLKDRVAALVYADSGLEAGRRAQSAPIELLVVATSAWLELISLRKQSPRESVVASEKVEAPATQTVSQLKDPFAGHTPKHAAAAAAAGHESAVAEIVPTQPSHTEEAGAEGGAVHAMSEEEVDTHRKAQRFARLLVDEIKLYNQAKVAEGRKNKDLYDRLKEDIEKSRATFKKRYGNTVAGATDYFQTELVRSLAEDDVSVMGANFRR
jgi:hypothetical protein